MTRQLAPDDNLRCPDVPSPNRAAAARAAIPLLAELERSLEAGQRALLARDLEGLERATCEQIGLRRSLEILWPQKDAGIGAGVQTQHATEIDRALAASLRAAQWRVLYQGRVQAALVRRAQRSLRIISHRLSGPGASYAAPSYARPASNPVGSWPADKVEEKVDQNQPGAGPCRV